MIISIKHRFTDDILYEHDCEDNSLKKTLEFAVKNGAILWGASLWGASLSGASLSGANLEGANLEGAYLWGAYLWGVNLSGANLEVKIPPNDHFFISEILFRNAESKEQKDFAARIRMETDKCWEYFYRLAKEKEIVKWVKSVLFQWNEFVEISIKLEKGE